jgi:hypothetical protein
MDIDFNIDCSLATLSRSWFTGKMALEINGQELNLQNPLNPATHFSVKTFKVWSVEVANHNITIEKERPLFMAGLRPQTYRIFVDDQLVAEQTGY